MTAEPIATIQHHVSMTDVDLVQINFSRYFAWMDEGYGALLRACGHSLSSIIASGFATPVVSVTCDYQRPIGLDHPFQVRSAITGVKRSSYLVTHRFEDDGGLFAVGRATHVWIRTVPEQSAEPAPDWIRDAVAAEFTSDLPEFLGWPTS